MSTYDYNNAWNQMNALEDEFSKLVVLKELINCALNASDSNDIDKTQNALIAANEYLEFLETSIHEQFQVAWKATVKKQSNSLFNRDFW